MTADWLTAAFRETLPGVTVLRAEVLEVIHSTTTKIRMKLELDEAGKAAGIATQVIVKGGFQEHSRGMDHMHLREVRGYRDIYPENPLPHPACWFAGFDPAARQGILVMEDLSVRGVEFCHATKPQSREQVARRLGLLAAFHARTWDSDAIRPGGKWADLVDFFDVMRGFFDTKTSPENWARLTALPRGVAVSERFRGRAWMIDAWNRVTAYGQSLPYCVLHGDVHLGNLYIEPDGTPGFLDTLASRGPGMLEVAYHVAAAVDVADRAAWEGALVRHYLDELARHGATAPSFDAAMEQYALFQVYGHFIWLTTESHYQPEAVNTANAMRTGMAMLDHRTAERIAALPPA
ncbi:MAG: phosphotransferase [Sphingomonadales bacterium]|nr:phosphotransferase [Sphingomonadales bacterium]